MRVVVTELAATALGIENLNRKAWRKAIAGLKKVGWNIDHIYETELAREVKATLLEALEKAKEKPEGEHERIANEVLERRWRHYTADEE